MYDKVIFYCHYGSGDIHESREFVKEYMRRIPSKEYLYAHGKDPRILDDIRNLKYTTVTEDMKMRSGWELKDNILYINTWIGRDSAYVLPQVGCVIEMFWAMHNDIMFSMGMGGLEKGIYDYIPKIEFTNLNMSERVVELKEVISANSRDSILICNGQVHSNQAFNFDFSPTIKQLCENYKNKNFYTVVKVDQEYSNLYDLTDCNLNEIAYLSCFMNTLVGRKSGPHVFAQHLGNWLDPNKTCLSFTYAKHSGHFVLSNHMPMKKVWSGATSPDEVYKEIEKVL